MKNPLQTSDISSKDRGSKGKALTLRRELLNTFVLRFSKRWFLPADHGVVAMAENS